ncbi:MAG: glutaredoxin [Flavobacteriaceae bacterium]|nr:MAG: glutaredoxin [Flavobacteriaceae bacterium]
MKKQIEIFTAGCPVCEPVVQLVKETAGDNCEIITYNVASPCDSGICVSKLETYGIKKLPAIAVDGKLLSCCTHIQITKNELLSAGIGKC